jgi:hypothetical protein
MSFSSSPAPWVADTTAGPALPSTPPIDLTSLVSTVQTLNQVLSANSLSLKAALAQIPEPLAVVTNLNALRAL